MRFPPLCPSAAAAAARGGRGLAAPPAAREEESNALLKGMSVEPEEGFKVDRRS